MNLVLKVGIFCKQNKNYKEREYKNYNKYSKCYTNSYNKPLNFQEILEKEINKSR